MRSQWIAVPVTVFLAVSTTAFAASGQSKEDKGISTSSKLSLSNVSGGGVSIARLATSIKFGKRLELVGSVDNGRTGLPVYLERQDGANWQVLASSKTTEGGQYSFKVKLKETSVIRVRSSLIYTTFPQRIAVRASLKFKHRSTNAWNGQKLNVSGRLSRAKTGRVVHLQFNQAGKWRTVQKLKTRKGGTFNFSVKQGKLGTVKARVLFTGDNLNLATKKRLDLHFFGRGVASYYGGNGSTACGNRLTPSTIGVAHKTLPCGTKVTFYYNGRTVTAPVIDRGPFIAGRDWDLTEAVARKLGFPGVATVGYSIG